MKNSMARSIVPLPSAAGTGRKDDQVQALLALLRPVLDLLGHGGQAAGRALSITVRIGS
jgi:hypothetical protein